MNTRRLIAAAFAVGAVFTFGQISHAQAPTPAPGGQHMGHPGGGRMKMMADQLGLTEDQKAKIKPIMQAQRAKMEAVRGNTSLTPEAKRAQMKQIMEDAQSQIKPILTADQVKKWDAMRAAARANHEGGHGGGQGQ